MQSAPAISIRDLRVDYGHQVAVQGIDLQVSAGEICGLVGPNGAGKTSTFRVLATLLRPTYGTVRLCDLDIADHPEAARQLLGYMPDLAPVASDLKVWEFLDLFAAAHGLEPGQRAERITEVLEKVRLAGRRETYCKTLSRGMMQRLVLAKALLHRPKVLLLDEPASGMDPVSRVELRQTLRQLAAEGTAVLVSSHILTELASMCTTVAIMQQGKIVASGPIEVVTNRYSRETRDLRLRILSDADSCAKHLSSLPGIAHIQVESSEIRFTFSGDAIGQAGLLRALIQAGHAVKSFEEIASSIEDVVMELGLN